MNAVEDTRISSKQVKLHIQKRHFVHSLTQGSASSGMSCALCKVKHFLSQKSNSDSTNFPMLPITSKFSTNHTTVEFQHVAPTTKLWLLLN